IETIINAQIRNNRQVNTNVTDIASARKDGAVALFGEKYGEKVRVVSVDGFSKELCGGTHVQATGEIGLFKIVSESSSAAGIRRIEAITGNAAEKWVNDLQEIHSKIADKLNTPESRILEKIDIIIKQQAELEKLLNDMRYNQALNTISSILEKTLKYDDYNLIITQVDVKSTDDLRLLGDKLRESDARLVAILFTIIGDIVSISVNIGNQLTDRYHAGKLAGQIAAFVGGKGGGKPDSAMAGGKDIDKVQYAIEETHKLFK
ncbi:MAG: alanine--tRNA ligase, partial [Candidatus Cloacimonetes bacterium]|nr:alanine--tRNA ligase [Candidatus Cloacimonadota bacterium]